MTWMPELNRRQWLGAMAASAAVSSARLSWAGSADPRQGRVVFIILRGGLDGLFAVPATGDPAFAAARERFTEQAGAALPLDATFGLHPALAQMHTLYRGGELLVVHATGLAYHQRSHFDAQQVLESGGEQPGQLRDGWLGRALAATRRTGLAMTTAVPLVLRGWSAVDTWAPSRLPSPTDDLLTRLQRELGITFIHVTHNQEEALSMSDRLAVMAHGRIVQEGTPREIYGRPHSRLVANFIGETDFIGGRVVSIAGDRVEVQTRIGHFKGVLGDPAHPPVFGTEVTVSIRPECWTLATEKQGENVLPGRIGESVYLGEVAQHAFVCGDTTLKIFELNPRFAAQAGRGQVFATVRPEDVVVLAE